MVAEDNWSFATIGGSVDGSSDERPSAQEISLALRCQGNLQEESYYNTTPYRSLCLKQAATVARALKAPDIRSRGVPSRRTAMPVTPPQAVRGALRP